MEKKCLHCLENIQSFKIHLEQFCPKLGKGQIRQSSATLESGSYVCLLCQHLYSQKNQYQKHAKSCKRRSIKSQSRKSVNYTSINLLEETQKKDNQHQDEKDLLQTQKVRKIRKLDDQTFHESCFNYLCAIQKPARLHWSEKHQGFQKYTLFRFYKNFIDDIFSKLSTIVPEIKIEKLKKIRKFQWNWLIKSPNQIFDLNLIEKRLLSLDQHKQGSIKKALNQFYSNYPVQKFILKKQQKDYQQTQKGVLMPQQFLYILKRFFQTKNKFLINFSIDLMIIYQSGQRFPSSFQIITNRINQTLQKRKKNRNITSFLLKTTKNYVRMEIAFDQQLWILIQKINWTKFSLSVEKFQRLKLIFPFSLIEMRRGYITFLYLCSQQSSSWATSLMTGHKNFRNVEIYVQKIIKQELIKLKANLRIQNINVQPSYKPSKRFLQLSDKLQDKILLPQKWIENVFRTLKPQIQKQKQEINLLLNDLNLLIPDLSNIIEDPLIFQNALVRQSQEDIDSSESQQQKQQQIYIKNKEFILKNGFFTADQLFNEVESQCTECNNEPGIIMCKFCAAIYGQNCKKSNFCNCCKINIPQEKTFATSNTVSEIKLQMIEDYISEEISPNLISIIALIFARGLNYCNVSVDYLGLIIPASDFPIAQIKLKQFQKYKNLLYFPPLKLGIFGLSSIHGTGFGLFATQDIPKYVFIGQYAADLINADMQRFCVRQDMIFTLMSAKKPQQYLSIAPIFNCGYVPLINNLEKDNNCSSVLCIVEGRARIIVYTIKKIRKGQQIGYDYLRNKVNEMDNQQQDQGINFDANCNVVQEVISNNFDLIQQQSRESQYEKQNDNQNSNKLKIKNLGWNCYLNVVLQIFVHLKQIFLIPDPITTLFIELKKCYQRKYFNPNKLCKHLNEISQFKIGKQNDAHEFLVFMINKFIENKVSLDSIKVNQERKITCKNCLKTAIINQQLFGLYIDCQNSFKNLKNIQTLSDYKCECKSIQSVSEFTYNSFKQVLIVTIKRFTGTSKDQREVYPPPHLRGQKNIYQLKYAIHHIGSSIKQGHYTFQDFYNKVLISDQLIQPAQKVDRRTVYIVVYQKVQSGQKTYL